MNLHVRVATKEDESAIDQIAVSSGLFGPDEWSGVNIAENPSRQWLVCTQENRIVGAAMFGPEEVSDSLINLFFLAVDKEFQGGGVGSFIVQEVERMARIAGNRTFIVETSSKPEFENARKFYLNQGFVREAEIRDYYGSGDNKVVFWKSLKK